MTRKDYQMIADAMRSRYPVGVEGTAEQDFAVFTWRNCVSVLGAAFGSDNPAFDWHRFLKACEPEVTK